ncbi:hypothetical protein FLJC2902T_23650 [Flavobacterium limnosediminis JC2902]|uniref:Uncharacterized protein n=1 Tax=Flavobacterium limnosediminis JC2902 TaxID=1341181 RepID=V6SKP6_9FLAO|nr:hypothetical protein [Flavobacterium limnosediminis]ESU27024.1 hypothetical protein FLJC2902T_23650 [Flavobacterium limnosediminis JC2902]
MIANLPPYISAVFALTTIATLLLFHRIIKNSDDEAIRKKANGIALVLVVWLALQAVLALNNVYNSDLDFFPPKIAIFGVWPAIITIVVLFVSAKGRRFIDSLPLVNITYLNTIRVAVEIVLYWLFLNKTIPQLMTFEGRNFDILAGLTAPFIAYFGFTKGILNQKIILAWNFISLGLLANIVINAVLSLPTPIQQFAFDQPNIALLNSPFNWLPTFIVPIVLFGHLVSIRQLLKRK